MEVVHLTERNQDAVIRRVVSLIERGGVVAVPTDTVYGLAADALRPDSVAKVFRIKRRAHAKALPVFVRNVAMAKEYASVSDSVSRLLGELWPGQTTVVLQKRDRIPDLVTGGERTVGMRMPDHPFMTLLLAACPYPLIATSANLSGSEPASSAVEVQQTFRRHIPRPDLVVDGGSLRPSPSSTVFDLTNPANPKILRMGAITKQELDQYLSSWHRPKA